MSTLYKSILRSIRIYQMTSMVASWGMLLFRDTEQKETKIKDGKLLIAQNIVRIILLRKI